MFKLPAVKLSEADWLSKNPWVISPSTIPTFLSQCTSTCRLVAYTVLNHKKTLYDSSACRDCWLQLKRGMFVMAHYIISDIPLFISETCVYNMRWICTIVSIVLGVQHCHFKKAYRHTLSLHCLGRALNEFRILTSFNVNKMDWIPPISKRFTNIMNIVKF